jgi:ABC-type molybdenum transport system ATPase subunit/photorepair protein PhrA
VLAIGRALMTHPQPLILDETTEGLIVPDGESASMARDSEALARYLGV